MPIADWGDPAQEGRLADARPVSYVLSMRIIYLAFVIIFAGVLAIFAIENAASVAVALFGWQVVAPLSAVIVAVYLLGMATGGSVVSFIRHSLHRATQPSARGGRAPPAKS